MHYEVKQIDLQYVGPTEHQAGEKSADLTASHHSLLDGKYNNNKHAMCLQRL